MKLKHKSLAASYVIVTIYIYIYIYILPFRTDFVSKAVYNFIKKVTYLSNYRTQ